MRGFVIQNTADGKYWGNGNEFTSGASLKVWSRRHFAEACIRNGRVSFHRRYVANVTPKVVEVLITPV